ncbi:hypothetical protein M5E87_14875 [Flavonifractor plautii]|nr:hypothetical protein M5E87_14875 [Flavonifractor plautii]
MSELARRYAQALWQVSPDGEALERTARALMEEPALWEALCSPPSRPEKRAGTGPAARAGGGRPTAAFLPPPGGEGPHGPAA